MLYSFHVIRYRQVMYVSEALMQRLFGPDSGM